MLSKEQRDELRNHLNAHWSHVISKKESLALIDAVDYLEAEVERLRKALIESEAQADWLWSELRSTDAPHRLWKDVSSTTREHYLFHAEHRLIERGVIAKS